tara:strand:- start:17750 stop:18787 length:1038 start_codon:yes stop_codon:yes gene_type:complete
MFKIGNRIVGGNNRCLIVGEVAQAHDGSLGTAHAYIDAIADAGADAVKFQTHIASAESTPSETFRVHFSKQDLTRYDYWKRMEFTEEQWKGLSDHTKDRGLVFLSSPFSIESVHLLNRIGVDAWKVASGETTNTPMLNCMADTGLPILLSTGMSHLSEIDRIVGFINDMNVPLLLFQSTTSYPCPPEKIGLNMIPVYRERYRCPVGLSDHSGKIYTGISAASLGLDALEIHVTFHRKMFGPDVSASVTVEELQELVEGIRFIESVLANPVDKDDLATELKPLRQLFFKSVVACSDLSAGTVLRDVDLDVKKPGTGIPAEQLENVIGRRLSRDVKFDQLLSEDDFD